MEDPDEHVEQWFVGPRMSPVSLIARRRRWSLTRWSGAVFGGVAFVSFGL
jgi:hypothetical protein